MLQPPLGKPWLLYVLLGSSLALNLVMVLDRPSGDDADCDAPDVELTLTTSATADSDGLAAAPAMADGALADAAGVPVAAVPAVDVPANWRLTAADVSHSLARTFQSAEGEDGDALSAAYARLFVWDLDLRRDLQQGDRVEVAWYVNTQGHPEVAAARFHSNKLGRTLNAYRFQVPGESFARYFDADGREVSEHLVDGPLESYEQITSLLKDRPTHKGMDFKAPEGTPVKSPRNATVLRTDWNWHANGNCVELQYDDGTIAKMLHLSETQVKAGQRVSAGQVVALSGNTGRSTAPHLHYELHQGDKVVDPLDYHQTTHRTLAPEHLATFQAEVARLSATLDSAVAQR
ncbi:MAG: M23 family metallopeptidase [Alphaproteobacteria bacterium]|nr:M23 family metallopeptidase [Alphaproteobacteria bacterium]